MQEATERDTVRKYYTPDDIAHMTGTSSATVRRWIASGELASVKMGRLRRISLEALDDFIRRSSEQTEGEGDV